MKSINQTVIRYKGVEFEFNTTSASIPNISEMPILILKNVSRGRALATKTCREAELLQLCRNTSKIIEKRRAVLSTFPIAILHDKFSLY